jgi:hypothetical protein
VACLLFAAFIPQIRTHLFTWLDTAAVGHGEDDLAGTSVVRRHKAARGSRLQRGPGRLVVAVRRDQGQGQVQPGRGGPAIMDSGAVAAKPMIVSSGDLPRPGLSAFSNAPSARSP